MTVPAEGSLAGAADPIAVGGRRRLASAELRPVIASGLIRAVLIPVSAVLALGTAKVLFGAVGANAYGPVVFVGTLFQLLPFADLGVGAAVTRAVAAADDPARSAHVAAVLRRSLRVLTISAGVLVVAAFVLGLFGAWESLLGLDSRLPHANIAATATIVVFALQLPLAVGQRTLLGAGKNHVAIAIGIVQPATAFTLAVVLRLAGVSEAAFVLIYPCAVLTSSVVTTLVARRLTGLRLSPVAAWRPAPPNGVPARVLAIALPMFLMTVGLPIGLQCDKVIISHRLPSRVLSEYALCSQLYVPGWLVLSAAAFALLPIFTRRRAHGVPHRRLFAAVGAGFTALSVLVAVGFVLVSPLIADVLSDGHVRLGLGLRLAFAALLVVQTAGLVSSMVLNRPEEMRFQAGCVLLMMPVNVGLSWWLAGAVGVAGPVIASAASVGVLMTLPAAIRAARSRSYPTALNPQLSGLG